MKNIAPPSIENKPIAPPGPDGPQSTDVTLFTEDGKYYRVEFYVKKCESVSVYQVQDDKLNWYWIEKERWCIPTRKECGPFDSKEDCLKNIKMLYGGELIPIGYVGTQVNTEPATLK